METKARDKGQLRMAVRLEALVKIKLIEKLLLIS